MTVESIIAHANHSTVPQPEGSEVAKHTEMAYSSTLIPRCTSLQSCYPRHAKRSNFRKFAKSHRIDLDLLRQRVRIGVGERLLHSRGNAMLDYDAWKTNGSDIADDLCECPRCSGEGRWGVDHMIEDSCTLCDGFGEVSAAVFDAYTAGEDE